MQKAISKYWPVFVLPTLIAFIIGFIWLQSISELTQVNFPMYCLQLCPYLCFLNIPSECANLFLHLSLLLYPYLLSPNLSFASGMPFPLIPYFFVYFSSTMVSKIVSSTTLTHSSRFFWISFPQNLITVHPLNKSCLFTSSSRLLLLDIFLSQ